MSAKVLVTLDFDDTVSPLVKPITLLEEDDNFKVYDFGYLCGIRNSVIEFLQRLKELENNGIIDVVWVSSWEDTTVYFNPKSNGEIPQFDWIRLNHDKGKAIFDRTVGRGYGRVLSFEDDVRGARTYKRLAKNSELENIPVLTEFHCEKGVGITDRHIQRALKIIGEFSA